MDAFGALDVAAAQFRRALLAVRSDQFDLPTPCTDWSVRDLLNHVIGGEKRYTLLLRGASTAEVEANRGHEHLGENAVTSFDEAHAELRPMFRAPGALTMTVHHRAGDRSGSELLLMRTVEYAAHGWDLARAIGVDDTIDDDLAAYLAVEVADTRHLWETANGAFAAPVPTHETGSPQDRLLRLTGRLPG